MNTLEILETSPAKLASLGVEVIMARKNMRHAKRELAKQRAISTLHNRLKSKNQKELEAYVGADEEVNRLEAELIEKQTTVELAENKHDEVYNYYLSARKMAGMDEYEKNAWRGQTIKEGVE